MMTPQDAFEVIREAAEIAVDVAAMASLIHLRDSGFTREQAEEQMDEILRMISYGMPAAISEISEQCLRIAESENSGQVSTDDASKAMASTAYAVYARLGYTTANALVRRSAKGGAA